MINTTGGTIIMGKMQRDKGARGERNLVMHLRLLGYDARRVIRTRAVSGFETKDVPDVEVYINDQVVYTFENKYRKNAFGTIYELFRRISSEGVYRFSINSMGPFIALGTDFEQVKKTTDVHFRNLLLSKDDDGRTHQRILGLRKLLKGAQFLVIKDNNKEPLFIRYWGI